MIAASCDDCRTLLGGYVLHALEPPEDAEVRSHLAACPLCSAEHEQLAGIPGMLDTTGPVETPLEHPPAALEEAVLDRFAREHPSPRPGLGREPLPRRRTPLRARLRSAAGSMRRPLPAALAAAVAATTITTALLLLPGGSRPSPGTPSQDRYQATLAGVGHSAGARASADLHVLSSGTSVSLRVTGLRGRPDTVYELWCLRDDGAKVSAGTFRTDGSGRADVNLTTAAVPGEYHKLSVERKASAPSSVPGERVMAGEILYPSHY